MKSWQPFVVDLAIVISVTILGVMRVIPGDAVIAILAALSGARVSLSNRSGKLPQVPGATVALLFGVMALFGRGPRL